jgi:serine/threonine protein kinase
VSDDPRVGTELAGYRIESLLGWGGMSVVYLAEDLRLKRRGRAQAAGCRPRRGRIVP